MRKILFVCLLAASLVGVFSLSLYAAGKEAPAGELTIAIPGGGAGTQSPAKFNHKTHAVDCKTCHHKLDSAKDNYKCSSAGCHDNADAADKTSDKSFYRAYHDPASVKSCLGCHKKEKAAGKNAPVVCTQCHPKKG